MTDQRALVIGFHAPQPDRDSGSRRLFHFVNFLQEDGWDVSLVAADGVGPFRDGKVLERRGVKVYDGLRTSLEAIWADGPFNLVLIAYWVNAHKYIPGIRRLSPQTRIVVDSVDLHFLREAREALRAGDDGRGRMLTDADGARMAAELNTYALADSVLTVSRKEADLINDLCCNPALAFAVPDYEVMQPSAIPFDERRGILMLGSFQHPPNVQALAWLCTRVVPLLDPGLLERQPMMIVGNALDDSVRRLGNGLPNVRMIGWVPEVEPYLERSLISVVPLLSGAGTKRKMIQALAVGTPTVGTSIAVEGLDLVDGEHVLVADEPERFARAIERLATDETLWTRLARAGREHIVVRHGVDAAREPFRATIGRAYRTSFKHGEAEPEVAVQTEPVRPVGADHHNGKGKARAATKSEPVQVAVVDGGDGKHPAIDETARDVRLIAFYLPQFHPIPENDAWWGEGFTEWRNVASADPQFRGHYQPHIPADLGYYDLRLADTRRAQADLARDHGIFGFCYYHYWFDSKQLLEQPFEAVLKSGEPDFPFCLCWANDPWSRRWDGREDDLLQAQSYSPADDLNHIRALLPALADPRAIKVEGKPIFLVYRAKHLPEAQHTIDIWRGEVQRAGLPGIYLIAVETAWDLGWDATKMGFDAKVLFQPQFGWLITHAANMGAAIPVPGKEKLQVYDYATVRDLVDQLKPVPYRRYESVVPSWDNTARVGERAVILHGSTPEAYGEWLSRAIARARRQPEEHRLVFLNAWNEWAEGCHLEPDLEHGTGYLDATLRALAEPPQTPAGPGRKPIKQHA